MLNSTLLGSALLQCRRGGVSLVGAIAAQQCHSPGSHSGILPVQHEQARQAAGGQPTCSSRDAGVCSHDASQQQQQSGLLPSSGLIFSHLPSHEVREHACLGGAWPRSFASAAAQQAPAAGPGKTGRQAPGSSRAADQKLVLYRGVGMVPFRVLVRLKVFQLAGVAALAIPINTFLAEGSVSGVQLVMATALVVGCAVSSVTLWYYSRRYVGELSLLSGRAPTVSYGGARLGSAPPHARLCFSVLDFWGRREDNVVDTERLVPPLQGCGPEEIRAMVAQPLLPVDVEGDRQYVMSLRYGRISDKRALLAVLQGRAHEAAANGAERAQLAGQKGTNAEQ